MRHWIFDLDNTLYKKSLGLVNQIDERMKEYISQHLSVSYGEAILIEKDLYIKYGTTLRGLINEYGIVPGGFLEFVHDLDYRSVEIDVELQKAISALGGKKIVYTNGSYNHAEVVIEKLGIAEHIDAIYDIAASNFIPKPMAESYYRLIELFSVPVDHSTMFDDLEGNLQVAKLCGMRTVLVSETMKDSMNRAAFVDEITSNLAEYLMREADSG